MDCLASMKYAFWFDVMQPDTTINEVIAHFKVDANAEGIKLLKEKNIPAQFSRSYPTCRE